MPAHLRATNEQIIEAYKATGSIWKAAEHLGLCGQSVHERLQRMGYALINQMWTDEEKEAAKHLAEEGISIGRIAQRLGRTYGGVASFLSGAGIKHPYRTPTKPKRNTGFTKERITKFAKYILKTGMPVTKAAKQNRMRTTSLVNALQLYAPEIWAEYLRRHAHLKEKPCPGCGNNFVPLSAKQKYCDHKCGSHARADVTYFAGNRRNTIGLSSGICQLCEKKGKVLSSHHILGKENDPEGTLLIALCNGCHQVVGLLGRRTEAVTDQEFWQNLIHLCVARAWADQGCKSFVGSHVFVEIEGLTKRDLRDEGLLPESGAHTEILPLFEGAQP